MSRNRLRLELAESLRTDYKGEDAAPAPGASVGATLDRFRTFVEQTVRKHPLPSVVVGLVTGVALGWLVKRR